MKLEMGQVIWPRLRKQGHVARNSPSTITAIKDNAVYGTDFTGAERVFKKQFFDFRERKII